MDARGAEIARTRFQKDAKEDTTLTFACAGASKSADAGTGRRPFEATARAAGRSQNGRPKFAGGKIPSEDGSLAGGRAPV